MSIKIGDHCGYGGCGNNNQSQTNERIRKIKIKLENVLAN